MGQGISSLRLRKAIVIRAYNLRSGDETLEEQFKSFAFPSDDGELKISLLDIKACLSFAEISWADDMIKRLIGDNVRQDVLFSEFIEFLETGSCPVSRNSLRESQSEGSLGGVTTTESLTRSTSAASPLNASASSSKKKKPQKDLFGKGAPAPGRARSKDLPPHPPGMSRVEKALALAQAIDLQQSELLQQGEAGASSLMVHPSVLCRGSPSSSSVWRKRELVRQERTVQYTTIDVNGTLQELVEKETSETEILHMESRETGEFAHRETTVYEQRETFNDEVVGEQHGVEEYVHLKSLEDEFEYMESTMPKKQGAGGEGGPEGEGGDPGYQQQASPRVHDAQGAEGAEASAHTSNLDLDDEALAFLHYQELQQQYEQEEMARRTEGQGVEYDEVLQTDDLPRSWWTNHAAAAEDFTGRPSHLDEALGQDRIESEEVASEPELAKCFEDID